MSSISSSIREVCELLGADAACPLSELCSDRTILAQCMGDAPKSSTLRELAERAKQLIESRDLDGYGEAFRALRFARSAQLERVVDKEPSFLESEMCAAAGNALQMTSDRVRLLALRIEDDRRNEALVRELRSVVSDYLDPAATNFRNGDINAGARLADLGCLALSDLFTSVWGDFRQAPQDRRLWSIHSVSVPHSNKLKNEEDSSGKSDLAPGHVAFTTIPWFEHKSFVEGFSHVSTDLGQALLACDVQIPITCATYLNTCKEALKPADDWQLLKILRLELCFLARFLAPIQSKDREPSSPNETFSARLYNLDFEFDQALGGGLLAAISDVLGDSSVAPPLKEPEQKVRDLMRTLRKVEQLLSSSDVEQLSPPRQTEAAQVLLLFTLRFCRQRTAELLEMLNGA